MKAKLDNYLISSSGEMKMRDKTETEWILACLRSTWETGSIDKLDQRDSINWEHLLSLSNRERVSPLIYTLTNEKILLPPLVQEQFQQIYHQNLVRNTHLLHELGLILDRMAKENIPVILLKGAGLIESSYQNPAARPMADLDLLILPEYIQQARIILEDAGYGSPAVEPWPEFNQRYRQVVEYSKRDGGRYSYLIDLHWGILDIPHYEHIQVGDIFERAIHADNFSSFPCPEDHFLVLCGHLGLHERYNAPLIRYYDLALLIQQGGEDFSWEKALERGTDWQLAIPVQRALFRLNSLWPEIVPESVSRKVAEMVPTPEEHRIHSLVVDRQRNPTSDVLFYFATMPGFSRKSRYFLEQAFPSPAYMRQLYCPHRPYLWPLTYILRAGLVFQYLSQARQKSSAHGLL